MLPPTPPQRRSLRRLLLWLAVLTALALVFISYLQPAFVVELGNRFWSCF
ncbi:MAG: hypothetical protein RJA44_2203 [Pseudomonadota bacterium]|jgi:hypothetical protein